MLESARKLLASWFTRGTGVKGKASSAPNAVTVDTGQSRHDSLLCDGNRHYHAGNYLAAADCFERVVELAHDNAEAYLKLGLAYQKLSRYEDAADRHLMALTLRPDYPQAHFNLGVLALERGLFDEAVSDFEKAISLKPDYVEALSNLGYAQLLFKNQLSAAKSNLARAIAIAPDFLDAQCNLGMLLQREGDLEGALETYNAILARDPSFDEARLNRALLLLTLGNFEAGWPEYEVRKRVGGHFNRRNFPYPEWDGTMTPGRSVLVYGEQGLGDEIMFASCIPDLISRGMRCVIDCSPRLEAIFRRSFPGAMVHGGAQVNRDLAWLSAASPIDCQAAIGSLPCHLRRGAKEFPRHSGYLAADPMRIRHWQSRLEALGTGLKVGISWRGGTQHTNRESRSLSLDQLLPLLQVGKTHFVSLQYTDCKEEMAEFRAQHGVILHHWQEAIDDYDETAALVTALDLTISVQTALVHLSGALGKPVWAMVPAVAEWRYQSTGETLPWYPTLRIFRQREPGKWQAVLDATAAELRRIVGGQQPVAKPPEQPLC